MLKVRFLLLLSVLSCSASCAYAGEEAAQEPAPTSGTITVEVRYKDTGEPVERAIAILGSSVRLKAEPTSSDGKVVFADVKFQRYQVELDNSTSWNRWCREFLEKYPSSKFVYDKTECLKAATLNEANPTARFVFEVQKGWQLSGRITKGDGSPLPDVMVMLHRMGPEQSRLTGAVTDSDGFYELFGLRPNESASIYVFGKQWSENITERVPHWFLGARLWEGRLEPTEESTALDLQIPVGYVEFECVLERAIWPFPASGRPFVGFQQGGVPAGGVLSPVCLYRLEQLPRATSHEGKGFSAVIGPLPADKTITFDLGFTRTIKERDSGGTPTYSVRRSCLARKEIRTNEGKQTLRLEAQEKYAALSRLVMAGAPLLVIVIATVVLVQAARRRRRRARD